MDIVFPPIARGRKIINYLLRNKQGSALISVALIALVSIGAWVTLLQLGKNNYKSKVKDKNAAQVEMLNSFSLQLLASKFSTTERKLPTWYLEPYPTADQMSRGEMSFVEVIKQAEPGVPVIVPTALKIETPTTRIIHYSADQSGMGSVRVTSELERKNDGSFSESQTAWLANGNPMALSVNALRDFFTFPDAQWPKTEGEFSGMVNSQVTFIKVRADLTYPAWAKELELSVKTQAGTLEPALTTARVFLDPPPPPQCRLELAPGQTLPLLPKGQARFLIKADSITRNAKISSDGFLTYEQVPTFERQSIRQLASYTPIASEIVLSVPEKPIPGTTTNKNQIWTVKALVEGVTNGASPSSCELDIPVKLLADPICNLTANPQNLSLPGQSTLLTLSCINPVKHAKIDGKQVAYDSTTGTATAIYIKKSYEAETVLASAVGPEGGKSDPSTVVGKGCKWNNPQYSEMWQAPWGGSWQVSHAKFTGYTYSVGGIQYGYYYGGSDTMFDWYIAKYGWGNASNFKPATYCPDNSLCMWGLGCKGRNCEEGHGNMQQIYAPADSESCTLQAINLRDRGAGCFIEGTRIRLANGEEKKIEEVRRGDLVWNPLLAKGMMVQKVIAGPESKPLWTIKVEGNTLRVTHDHPFRTQKGTVQARELKSGDRIRLREGWMKVSKAYQEKSPQKSWVWNIELAGIKEEEHFVSANGIPSGDLWLQNSLKQVRVP